MSKPLSGLLVVSLEQAVAAPMCTCRLADAGARVIKIERPEGDFARGYDKLARGESAYFVWLNRGKESVVLDLTKADDKALLEKMLARADVFIQNLKPGAIGKLGFAIERLRRDYPKLICVSISGFGESGPEAHRPGYDLIVQGESGVMDITGFPDGPPVKVGNSIGDLVAGMAAAQGITLALLSREKTGKGQKVEIGMLDVMASLLTYQAGLYWNGGGRPARRGNEHPSIVPYEVFKAQDVYITLGVANNSLWDRTCKALDRPDLIKDPRFDTEANRVTNRKVLVPLLNEILRALPSWSASSFARR